MRLLSSFGIRGELVSYHEHNKREAGERIAARLLGGESCALVTDAGMPAISDPGEDLVRLCAEAGVTVTVVPGACAAVSALALSGLATGKFCFEGFLSATKGERRRRLEELRRETRTVIYYEAPHKLRATLLDMAKILGEERRVSISRELTKINEETVRVSLGEAVRIYTEREPRGEYVLVVEGAADCDTATDNPLLALSPEDHVAHYERTGMPRMAAIKAAAKDRGVPKSELYKLLITE